MATTIKPVVSLSSRCTMPGRLTPPIPDKDAPQWAISAFTSVPGLVAGGGMHNEALGLVDDDDVLVLEHDIEGDILAFGLRRDGRRHVDCDRIAGSDMISGVAHGGGVLRRPGDRHLAGEDQRLQPRPRQSRAAHGEHAIEPGRAFVALHRDIQPLIVHSVKPYLDRSVLLREP